MMRVLCLALVFALTGCQDGRVDQASKCEFEAQKAYPQENTSTSSTTGRFIELCMRSAGYDFDNQNPNCVLPAFEANEQRNPYCYRPRK